MSADHSSSRRPTAGAVIFLVLSVILVCGGEAQAPPASPKAADTVELLFVQNSIAGRYDGKTLTLTAVGPTVFFSDRPQRVAGQVHTVEFIRHWDKGSDNFADNPPNASLSIFGDKEIRTVVIELTNPKLNGTTLSYTVRVLRGQLPAAFKESSLFIDILGRWRMAAYGEAVGEARGMKEGAAMAQSQYAYHPAPAPAPAPAAPTQAAPVYSAPPPAGHTTPTASPTMTGSQSAAVAKLKELKSLREQGLITQSQYEAESQKLLNELVK